MSISSEISRISQNISDSLTAVAAKGVIVPSGANSDDLANLIGQISGGGTIWETVYNGTEIFSEDWGNGAYYVTLDSWEEEIGYGSVWKVVWDGTPYQCTATEFVDTGGDPYCIGNCTLDGGQSGSEYPFFMQVYWGNHLSIVCSVSGSHTIIIQKQVGSGTTWTTVFDDDVTINTDNPNYFAYSPYRTPFQANETYRVTWGTGGTQYLCDTYTIPAGISYDGYGFGNAVFGGGPDTGEPFGIYRSNSSTLVGATTASAGTIHIKIEKQVSSGGSTLITKTITANGTYDAEDDDADGYSEVTVAIPTGTAGTPTATKGSLSNNSISVTPSVTNTAGIISGGTINGTAVTVTASELASGNKSITSNGTGIDVVGYATVSVSVSGGSMNTQTNQSTTRTVSTSLTTLNSLTCSKTGTYTVYWTCVRTNTSQTWGSRLYIDGTAYNSENTTWSNYVQNNTVTGVSISKSTTVEVYGRSRGSGYYIYAPQLTIVQTA